MKLSTIIERGRFPSPAAAPQALAWNGDKLWMGSRDLRRIYVIDPKKWEVLDEKEPPGIPWAAVATNGTLRFTIGEGPDDDRYICRFAPEIGFSEQDKIACPEFTGSYLSYDGEHLYLSNGTNIAFLSWTRMAISSASSTSVPKSQATRLSME